MDDLPDELFGKAFEELRDPLFRYLRKLAGGNAEAEDLTQECFHRLNQELRSNKQILHLKAWLFRTGHNLAIDFRRRKQRTAEHRLVTNKIPLADEQKLSLEIMMRGETSQRIRKALKRLSAQQRKCLLLRAAGMRYRDIAENLGVTEGTVCKHMQRGRTLLKRHLTAAEV